MTIGLSNNLWWEILIRLSILRCLVVFKRISHLPKTSNFYNLFCVLSKTILGVYFGLLQKMMNCAETTNGGDDGSRTRVHNTYSYKIFLRNS